MLVAASAFFNPMVVTSSKANGYSGYRARNFLFSSLALLYYIYFLLSVIVVMNCKWCKQCITIKKVEVEKKLRENFLKTEKNVAFSNANGYAWTAPKFCLSDSWKILPANFYNFAYSLPYENVRLRHDVQDLSFNFF